MLFSFMEMERPSTTPRVHPEAFSFMETETRYHTQSSPGGARATELEFQMLRHSPGPPPRPVDGLALKPLCHCPADSKPSGSTLAPAARGHVDAPGQPCSPESARRQDGCEPGLSVPHPLRPPGSAGSPSSALPQAPTSSFMAALHLPGGRGRRPGFCTSETAVLL